MERRGDGENYGALCAELRGDFHGAFNGAGVAGNYGLLGGIEICGGADFAVRGALAGIGYDGGREAHDGGPGANAGRDGFLHVGAALADQLDGIGKLQGTGGDQSGVFPKTVASYKIRSEAFFREDAMDGNGASEDGGLRVGGELELVLGAFEADFGDGETESFIGLVENGASSRILVGQLF